jgi:hypothetical protein
VRSTKLYSATLAFGLIFSMAGTLAAQNVKAAVDGGIGMYNACDPIANFAAQGCSSILSAGPACYNSIVWVPGSTEIGYLNNGGHASVHVLFHNDGQDYRVNLEANQQFDNVASNYFVPFHSVFVSLNGGSTFKMDGTINVAVDANGTPVNSNMVLWDPNYPLSLSCANQ